MDRQFDDTKSLVFTDCMLTMKDTMKHKKGANILHLDLEVDKYSKNECLHSRKRNLNSSILKNKSKKLS